MDETIKIPLFFRSALFIFIGGVSLFLSIDENPQQAAILKVITITIATIFFTYGVVCFVQDVKEGGIYRVLQKLKGFFYGDD